MKRCHVLILASMLLSSSAMAASMADVDALVDKAQSRLRSMTTKDPAVMRDAVDLCNDALDVLQEVRGISEDDRDSKAAKIMSMIYWCRKMMPLDLSGRSISTAGPKGEAPSSGGDEGAAEEVKKTSPKTKSIDEIAYTWAEDFERKNAAELQQIVSRYAAIAASFPTTTWGKKASERAERARKTLDAARAAVLDRMNARILKLDLEPLLVELAGGIAEASDGRKQRLEEIREDIVRLKSVWDRLVTALEATRAGITVPLAEFGHKKDGWVRGGGADGVLVATGSPSGEKSNMPWPEFGAAGMARLATRVLSLRDGKSLEDVAVAATVAGDYTTAHSLFEKLLLTAPERLSSAAGYFERALGGYRQSAEGDTTICFDRAKKLVRERKYGEAMRELTALQEKLARNSEMKDVLEEVAAYRGEIKRRFLINDQGEPMSVFEKKVSRAFGGDAKLDEKTGEIEIFYDFEDGKQLRDWTTVRQFGKPSSQARWRVARGTVSCGGGSEMLMWRFPLDRYDIEADVTYDKPDKEVRFYTCLSEKQPSDVFFGLNDGAARLYFTRLSGRRNFWRTTARFIWRKGETAHLRIQSEPESRWPFRITVNGKYGVSGVPHDNQYKGCVAFCFDGGTGQVDNVLIRGKLDMAWFEQATRGIR